MSISIANIDDCDPISLEPIQNLTCYFDFEYEQKVYRYDAWAWLELFLHEETDQYIHPLFRVPISLETRQQCFDACQRTSQKTTERKNLLKQCQTVSIHKKKSYSEDGKLVLIHIFPESPLYNIAINQWWWKWNKEPNPKPIFAKSFNCEAAIDFSLVDISNKEVLHRRIFI